MNAKPKPVSKPEPVSVSESASVSFDTILSAFGNNTGVVVPEQELAALGAGKRPAVVVTLNGYEYPTTVGAMGGQSLISVSAAVRKATGLSGGDPISVKLVLADGPREVIVPPDFAAALEQSPVAAAFFSKLSNSLQRFHIDSINGAKSDDTRQRRIEKAVALFLAGKPR
jgi:hypothetical protein